MTKAKKRKNRRAERQFSVRAIRRDPPDVRKLSRALIGLAEAEAERDAQAEQATRDKTSQVPDSATQTPTGGELNASQ